MNVGFNAKNLGNVRFTKLNSYHAMSEHTTAKSFADQNIDEPTLFRSNRNNDFKNNSNISQNTLNSIAKYHKIL